MESANAGTEENKKGSEFEFAATDTPRAPRLMYYAADPDGQQLQEPELPAGAIDVLDAIRYLREWSPVELLENALSSYVAQWDGNETVSELVRLRRESR